MNQHIHCIVHDCHYWQQGNKCKANEILVSTDGFGASQPDRIDATMASQLSTQAAGSCMATCCKTYVAKDSDAVDSDQVTKIN